MTANDRSVVTVETHITSTTTDVYMLGYRTRMVSSIASSNMLDLLATFTISHLAFHLVAEEDHLRQIIGFTRFRGVPQGPRDDSELLIDVYPFRAASDP